MKEEERTQLTEIQGELVKILQEYSGGMDVFRGSVHLLKTMVVNLLRENTEYGHGGKLLDADARAEREVEQTETIRVILEEYESLLKEFTQMNTEKDKNGKKN